MSTTIFPSRPLLACGDMKFLKQTFLVYLLFAATTAHCLLGTLAGGGGRGHGSAARITQKTISKGFLVKSVMKLLTKLERSKDLDASMKFAVILSEFLIKQHQRYIESNRYEQQANYHLLQKLDNIIRNTEDADFENVQKKIIDNIFQKNVLLKPPILKERHIDTHFEYKSLLKNYTQLVDMRERDMIQSDECLSSVATLDSRCQVPQECLDFMVTDLPSYGYKRMHQILLLYVFMHHICAPTLGSETAYEILASQKCTQVYREQNVLRHMNIPDVYRDLYLEQNVICGLFGYIEFMNWHNLVTVTNWPQEDECLCLFLNGESKIDCNCTNHINSLVLVYYINGFLLLN
ncbi:uncharacterized protein LOC106080700 isoform X2 [Stomoxys calcitrans]|uniref:uncharacterized protein LOC106080700 isoform X2 n=1 Tax=Stomoxys calcitrans TaxID=35570 RepID=UPI0027E3286F|nr:uncharacterized protein LOC106080700 isoform X2 [Stomoxys calcitrans]